MRGVIWLVLLFVVAVVAATTLGRNDGLVSIYFGAWRIDLSLNLFVLLVLAACAVLMAAARSVNSLISLPQRAREWRAAASRARGPCSPARGAGRVLRRALQPRAPGGAARAGRSADETEVLRSDGEFRVLAHLLAAASLHRLQDRTRRDELMRQLRRKSREGWSTRPVDEGARLLAAEWAIDDRDAPRAHRAAGRAARRRGAAHAGAAAAAAGAAPDAAAAAGAADGAAAGQAPGASRPRQPPGLLRTLAVEALDGARDADALRRVWQQLDAADRRDATLAARAATRAAAFGAARGRARLAAPVLGRHRRARAPTSASALRWRCWRPCRGLPSEWLPRLESAALALPNDPARRRRRRHRDGRAAAVGQGAPPAGAGRHRRRAVRPGPAPCLALAGTARPAGRRRAARPAMRTRCSADRLKPGPVAADIIRGFAAVAQLDRVLGYEPRGRGFDSCQPHQYLRGSTG